LFDFLKTTIKIRKRLEKAKILAYRKKDDAAIATSLINGVLRSTERWFAG